MVYGEEFIKLGNQKQIYIKTTEQCNLRCKHCYIGSSRDKSGFFDEVATVKWVQEWLKLNNSSLLISFHGGEPFVCPMYKLQYVVDHLRSPNVTFNATTNLVYNLDDKLDFIKSNFVDPVIGKPFIKTSWDPIIRFKNNEEALWASNVKKLVDNGVVVQVIVCLTPHLLELDLFDVCNNLKELGVKIVRFERITGCKELTPNYLQQDEWLCRALEYEGLSISNIDELKNSMYGTHIGCRARSCMSNVLTINADGTVGGCPNTSLKKGFTNINNNPLSLIHNDCRNCLIKTESIRDLRCYTCELFDVCNGDCHQLEWQGEVCPAPRKLMEKLKGQK